MSSKFLSFQSFRVFYDRLVDDSDRKLFCECIRDRTKKDLDADFSMLFRSLDSDQDGHVTEDDIRSLMYCDFSDTKSDSRRYMEVSDVSSLKNIIEVSIEVSKRPYFCIHFFL